MGPFWNSPFTLAFACSCRYRGPSALRIGHPRSNPACAVVVAGQLIREECVKEGAFQMRVELLQVYDWQALRVLHLEDHRHESCHGRPALQMSDTRFVGRYGQGRSSRLLAHDPPHGAHFDRVTQRRACAVAVPDARL